MYYARLVKQVSLTRLHDGYLSVSWAYHSIYSTTRQGCVYTTNPFKTAIPNALAPGEVTSFYYWDIPQLQICYKSQYILVLKLKMFSVIGKYTMQKYFYSCFFCLEKKDKKPFSPNIHFCTGSTTKYRLKKFSAGFWSNFANYRITLHKEVNWGSHLLTQALHSISVTGSTYNCRSWKIISIMKKTTTSRTIMTRKQLMLSGMDRVDTLRLRGLSFRDLLSYSFYIHKQEVAVMNSCPLARRSWLYKTTLKLS